MRRRRGSAGLLSGLALLPVSVAFAAAPGVNALDYPGPAWSPYVVGAGIGVLSWLTFYCSDKPIGASSFYAQIAGLLGKAVAPGHTEALVYFQAKPPHVTWGFVFVLATIAGAAISALGGGEFANEWLPPMWELRFGDSVAIRAGIGFGGGMLMALGARLAGGCTSGHGISGTMQLNPGSWITIICLFVGGVAVAFPLFTL